MSAKTAKRKAAIHAITIITLFCDISLRKILAKVIPTTPEVAGINVHFAVEVLSTTFREYKFLIALLHKRIANAQAHNIINNAPTLINTIRDALSKVLSPNHAAQFVIRKISHIVFDYLLVTSHMPPYPVFTGLAAFLLLEKTSKYSCNLSRFRFQR